MKIDFGHFLEIGTSDGLDIAYYASTKHFLTFGHDMRLWVNNYACISNMIYAKPSQNEVFSHFIELTT